MEPNLQRLILISGQALCDSKPKLTPLLGTVGGSGALALIELLNERNGFYAFESALHVLPSQCLANAARLDPSSDLEKGSLLLGHDDEGNWTASPMDLEHWNSEALWRADFELATEGLLFFAEDVFGEQFALSEGKVLRFNPESGETTEHSPTLDSWAEKIVSDYSYETGYEVAHDWQLQNSPLIEGHRLIPKLPFIMGGKYEVNNLYSLDAVKAMRYRADIWKQLRTIPDGTPVKLKVIW